MAAIVAALCLLAVPSSALAVKTIGLSTAAFKFTVEGAQTVQGEVFVTNDGDEPIKAFVYASDQEVDEAGNISYTVPSRGDLSTLDRPSTWTQIIMPSKSKSLGNLPYLELKPGERVPVKFAFTVPSNVPPGDHNLMIFFELFDMPQEGATQTAVSGRVGARVALRVKGEVIERVEIRPFEVPSFVVGSGVPYRFVVDNTAGNTNRRFTVTADLLNRDENTVESQTPLDASLVFAQESQEGSGTLVAPARTFGPHTVDLRVMPVDDNGKPIEGGKGLITEARTVWILPLWLVGVAAFILIVLLAVVIRAVTTRKAAGGPSAPAAE